MNQKLVFKVEHKEAICKIKGYFYYRSFKSGEESIRHFLDDFFSEKEDFNECFGSYHFEIEKENKRIVFDDNSGMTRSFYDVSTLKIGNTLDEVIGEKSVSLNYNAIAQFLYYGCTYDCHTIVEGVCYTNPEKYYVIENNQIIEKNKELDNLNEIKSSKDILEKVMKRFCDEFRNDKIACTITGGTDSRSVLAHILANGINPQLVITGSRDSSDVVIGKKIARVVQSEIKHIETKDNLLDLYEDDIKQMAGLSELCARYRLLKKAKWLNKEGINIECGGVGGESYKNSFINQDYPWYRGKPKWDKFYQFKVSGWDFPKEICGDRIKEYFDSIKEYTQKCIQNGKVNKNEAYLDAGYYMLQCRFAPITIFQSQYFTPYNPLLERTVVAYPYTVDPKKLDNYAFQRFQVSHYCEAIKSIVTDRGLTCDYNKRKSENLKGMLFLIKVYLSRIFHRKTSNTSNNNNLSILENDKVIEALQYCKRYQIINCDYSEINVKGCVVDRLFSLGCFLINHNIIE